MKEKTCILQGFYELVYYNLVSREDRSTIELKKKASTSLSFKKKNLSKIAERNSQQKKKRKIR